MTAGPKFYISQSVIGQVKTIAANDGGDKKSKIDTRKGYDELCNLIAGNSKMTRTDKQYLMALKAEYLDLREEGEQERGKAKVKVNGVELLVSKEVIDYANRVAKNDGGKFKDEVDNGSGYKELVNLLNNSTIAMTSADRAYIKILIVYYEEKYLGKHHETPVEPEPEPEPMPPVNQDPPKAEEPTEPVQPPKDSEQPEPSTPPETNQPPVNQTPKKPKQENPIKQRPPKNDKPTKPNPPIGIIIPEPKEPKEPPKISFPGPTYGRNPGEKNPIDGIGKEPIYVENPKKTPIKPGIPPIKILKPGDIIKPLPCPIDNFLNIEA